jgi:hypothetical protein
MRPGRIDITERVIVKLEAGKWVLYYNKRAIGQLTMTGLLPDMADGFEFIDGRVYAAYPAEREQKHYVSNCDMGWC